MPVRAQVRGDAPRMFEHDHLSLGKIDDGGGLVNDAEAQGDEGVDGAVGQAGDGILQEGGAGRKTGPPRTR
jgi:hypothetical protein